MWVQYTYIQLTLFMCGDKKYEKAEVTTISRGVSSVCMLLLTDYTNATGFRLFIVTGLGVVLIT